MDKYLFALDGVWSNDIGVTLQGPVKFSARKPKLETISVPGKNGDLHIYDGSYENIAGSVGCYVLKEFAYEYLERVTKWLLLKTGYRRLEVSGEPDYFRLARIKSGPEEAIRKYLLAPFNLEFDCDPRKFLKEGETAVTVSNGQIIFNPGFTSNPLILLSGNGEATLTVNDTLVKIKDMEEGLTLDCEAENAYKGLENKNRSINAPEFPTLLPGENKVSWTGGIIGVDIVPRWWV